ncbi:hypothetical protein KI387_022952, partial [Taxus chinensis]
MSFTFGNSDEFLLRKPANMQPFYEVYYEIVDDSAIIREQEEEGEEQRERKRRLSVEQVAYLERSFEKGSKLDPERKMQLASELGLKPRQVAVWYQNRRARWKTKQMEKDYDILRERYDAVALEKHKLESEVTRLRKEIQQLKARLEDNLSKNNKQIDDTAIISEEFYDDFTVLDDYPGTENSYEFN